MTRIRLFASLLLVYFALSCKQWEIPEYKGLVEMAFVKGGTFNMGSLEGYPDEKPVHQVTVDDFYMSQYEITVAQYRMFINETLHKSSTGLIDGADWTSRAYKGENHPVVYISHYDARQFCIWLSKKEGRNYRLPTEAEWEYAAGNGASHTRYSWGNSEPGANSGNLGLNNLYSTRPVGQYSPNTFMLYDMTGNVWEMVSDYYSSGYYDISPENNPAGPFTSTGYYVTKGGSYNSENYNSRIAYRGTIARDIISNIIGFRIVATE